jgi:hypothetical protein
MPDLPASPALAVADDLAARYAALAPVEAVALAGSWTAGAADAASDLDLYVYARAPIDPATRSALAAALAEEAEIDNRFWEPGDEWVDRASGIRVDIMYRAPGWIEEQLDRVLVRHEASVGYSTCLWHNVLTSRPLFDRHGWFGRLRAAADRPYPEPLRRAIVAKNHPILRATQSSYRYQIARALDRGDLVAVNHRVAALLASLFDILFALNRLPHPGEKRLARFARERCALCPPDLPARVAALIAAVGSADGGLLERADALLDGLDDLLRAEGVL